MPTRPASNWRARLGLARWLRESAKALASLPRSEDLERLDTHLKNRLDLVRKTGRAAATWSIGLDLKEPA